MFKEEIKKLAAEQVAERNLRQAKKAEDCPKQPPLRDDFKAWTDFFRAWDDKESYWQWFIASDTRKNRRRFQIRIRHLVQAFVRGVPYARLEARTSMDPALLAGAMLFVMRHLGVAHDMAAVAAWLGLKASAYIPRWWTAEYLGLPATAPVEASVG